MARRLRDITDWDFPWDPERTRPITGFDASVSEAEMGDAGNGSDPYVDFPEGLPEGYEHDPDLAEDILPDRIERDRKLRRQEEEETARPFEVQPIDPAELP